jgi:hypothetical protein
MGSLLPRGRARLRAVTALACALAALVPSVARADSAPADFYGINASSVLDLPADERDRHLDEIARGGITDLRMDASWIGAEPNAPDPVSGEHHYVWTRFDTVAATLAAHGLRWYPILDYSTNWSGRIANDPFSAPADLASYAAYARAFAARYGPGGEFWAAHPELPSLPTTSYELGNEPNSAHFWHPQSDAPEVYADLYAGARAAIRAVQPRAKVVTGGLLEANATDPNLFLRRMLRHRPDLRGAIDAVGYHPYLTSIQDDLVAMQRVRATLDRLGLKAVPLEITEVGQPTNWVPEPMRSTIIGGLARRLPASALKVTRFMPFTWFSAQEDGYGIVNRDGSPKPTGAAYLAAISAVRAAPPTATAARRRRAPRAEAARAHATKPRTKRCGRVRGRCTRAKRPRRR